MRENFRHLFLSRIKRCMYPNSCENLHNSYRHHLPRLDGYSRHMWLLIEPKQTEPWKMDHGNKLKAWLLLQKKKKKKFKTIHQPISFDVLSSLVCIKRIWLQFCTSISICFPIWFIGQKIFVAKTTYANRML